MVGIHALAALILFSQDPDPLKIAEGLRSPDAAQRRTARAQLVAIGESAVDPLIQLLMDRFPGLEQRAAELIAKLNDDDVRVRDQASDELEKVGARVRKLLEKRAKAAEGETRWRLSRVLGTVRRNETNEKQATARQKASLCRVLGRLREARASAALLEATKHAEESVRRPAIRALGLPVRSAG